MRYPLHLVEKQFYADQYKSLYTINEDSVMCEVIEATFDDNGVEFTPKTLSEGTPTIEQYFEFFTPNAEGVKFMAEEVVSRAKEDFKILKVKTLDELTITANTVAFDANGKAIGNMGAVLAVANFKFNQALSVGVPADIAYQSIFKDTKIGWKGADNAVHAVQIETVAEALEKSMHAVAEVLGV